MKIYLFNEVLYFQSLHRYKGKWLNINLQLKIIIQKFLYLWMCVYFFWILWYFSALILNTIKLYNFNFLIKPVLVMVIVIILMSINAY